MLDHCLDLFAADHQRAKQVLWKARLTEQLSDRKRTARHIRCVLKRRALPAIKPGAANRNTCQNGKFHGITASTTPIGLNVTKLLRASV